MSNRNYQYLDPDLDPRKAADHTLLVQAGTDSFSFAVTDGKRLLLLSNNLSLDELNGQSDDDDLLFGNYGRKIIALSPAGFTFVPSGIFSPEKVADLARFLDVKSSEKVFSHPLDTENQVVFKVCGALADKIAANFDLQDVVFGASGWIKSISNSGPGDSNLYLNLSGNKVEILNFKEGKLRFYNAFEFMSEDELAYFTTIVGGDLQIAADNITLYLSGDVEADDKNFNRLRKFFSRVDLNSIKPLKLPSRYASHPSLKLTALALCGSSAAH